MQPGALALLIVILWGLNWPAASIALGQIPPLPFRVATLALGGLLLLLYCLMRGIPLRPTGPRALSRLMGSALLNVAAWNLLSVYAIVELDAARSAILAFTMPFWTALAEWLLGQAPSPAQRLALALGAAGLGGLIVSACTDPSFSGLGAVLMLLAALAWAGGTIQVKRYPVAMPRAAFTTWTLLLGALMVGLLLPLQPAAASWRLDTIGWPAAAAFLYAACIGMALCQACWFALLGKLGPTGSALDLASLALLLAAAALPPLQALRARRR